MNLTIRHTFLLCSMLLLIACGQTTIEPGLEAIPTVAEPTEEVVPTETPSPTNTPAPSPTATAEPTIEIEVEVEATEEPEDEFVEQIEEELADLLGMNIITEGTLAMDTLGVSFDLPEGWSGIELMGLMMMATNAELDPDLGVDTPSADDGVIVVFVPTAGSSFEEMSSYSTEELMDEFANGGNDIELQEIEVIQDQVPVTLNGYNAIQTSVQGINEGEPMFIEMNILEHDGMGYMMMYVGSPDEIDSEKENYDALIDTLELSSPDQAALEEASEEMMEDLTGMFGGGVVTEGRIELPAVGVSFEVPEGWTAMNMMGFLGMATNGSMDSMMDDDQLTQGVVVMFTPATGATLEEAWGDSTNDLMAEMTGPGSGIDPEDMEIIEEQVPVTVNGYAGQRTSLQFEADGILSFMEMTILEHEGSTYTMLYAGTADDYEAEQGNYEQLINSLILTEPDLDDLDFGDFEDFGSEGNLDFEDEFSLDLEEPTVTEPLAMNETVLFESESDIGYRAEVEIGSSYLIYLHGVSDTILHLFPEGGDPLEYVDLQSDNAEGILWTADAPAITLAGSYFIGEGAQPLKLSIFPVVDLESNSQTITVNEGEQFIVSATDDEVDIKLIVESETDTFEIDFGYRIGSSEFVLLDEAGEYTISAVEWEFNEPAGRLFITEVTGDIEVAVE